MTNINDYLTALEDATTFEEIDNLVDCAVNDERISHSEYEFVYSAAWQRLCDLFANPPEL